MAIKLTFYLNCHQYLKMMSVKFTRWTILLFVTLSPLLAKAQELSTLGKTFWLTFYENYGGLSGCSDNSAPQLKVVISCNKATTGTVKNATSNVSMPFSIGTGGGVDTVLVPIAQGYCTGTESTSSRYMGLLIQASDTISVSAQNSKQYSCDATLVYPIEALGVDYRVISHMGDQSGNSSCYRSCFAIVATEDNTEIDITPSCTTAEGKAANTAFTITLDKGETYLVKANSNKLDLSGTLVQAKDCKKIALFSGSTRSSVLFGANNSCQASYDILYEQMMPINLWGKKFIVIPTIYAKNQQRKADMIRVVANQNSTTVRVNNKLKVLAAGQSDTFFITQNSLILTNKPVGICQFGQSENCDKVNGGSDTDPMMMWVPPIEQSLKNLSFVCENAQTINKFFLNVIVKTSTRSSFKIDGNAPTATWKLVTKDTSYSYIQQDGLSLGKHSISSPFGFSAVLYAYGDHGSYGFNAGSSIKPLSFYTIVNGKSSADFEPDSLFYTVCQGATIPFDAGGSNTTGVTWKWLVYENTGTTIKTVKSFSKIFNDTGIFPVIMIAQRPTNGVCNGLTSIDDSIKTEVRVYKKPDIIPMNDTTICLGNSLPLLTTTDGDTNYTWSPNTWLSCTKCYVPIAKPTMDTSYQVTATYKGCTPSTASLKIYVRDSIFLTTFGDTTICRGTSTDIFAQAVGGLSTDLTVTWDHGLGTGLNKTVSPLSTTTYMAILTDNCTRNDSGYFYADTSYVVVTVRDSLKITMPNDTIVCEGNDVAMTVSTTGGYPGASYVTWDNNLGTGLSKTVTMGTNDVTYKAVVADDCTVPNDSGYVTIRVRPSIKIDTVMFVTPVCKNKIFSVDARASGGDTTGYVFKLYDITGGNFNLIDSSKYNTFPHFNVKIKDDANFQIRMNQNCNSQQISKKFDVKIKNALSVSNPLKVDTICTGQSYSLANNGVSGDNLPIKFVLKRKNGANWQAIDSAVHASLVNFNITPSTSPTNYLIVGDDNCSRTDSSQFELLVRPPMNLTSLTNDELCRNSSKQIVASVTGGKAQSYSYRWTDITNNILLDTLNQTISLSPTNSMDIELIVSDKCSAPVNSSARIWVAPLVIDSLMVTDLDGCEPFNTEFIFPNTLAQNPLNPSFTWNWYFDGLPYTPSASTGGGTHPNIPKQYPSAGTYTAKVDMVLSNNKICFSKTQNVTAFEQAKADFTYLPRQIDIVEPLVSFTDQSDNGYAWQWNFGDGGTDNNKNPQHSYTDTGLFEVTLITNNSNNQCNDTVSYSLRVLDIYRIFIPDAFSPNSDEFNNIWNPSFTSIMTVELTIFNRWGEQLFYSNDNTGKWDGTFNGEECEQGVYYYHIKVRDNRKKWHYYNGTLTLIR